jgi:hypothetical protein
MADSSQIRHRAYKAGGMLSHPTPRYFFDAREIVFYFTLKETAQIKTELRDVRWLLTQRLAAAMDASSDATTSALKMVPTRRGIISQATGP